MHHLSYGNWWIFICSLFGWYNFYSRQNKLLDIEKNWGYIDILLSIFSLYFFHRYIPHCGDPDQLLMENFTNTLAVYLLAEFDQWEALGSMSECWRRERLKYLMPPIFLRLTQICFILQSNVLFIDVPWDHEKNSVGKPKIIRLTAGRANATS